MLNVSTINLAGLGIGVFILTLLYRRLASPIARIPGPEISNWTELVYSYYWLTGKAPIYVHHLHETYGPIVRTSPTQVDICDTSAVKEIHRTNTTFRKSTWYSTFVTGHVHNLFSATDPAFHGTRRRLLASPMADSSLQRVQPVIESHIRLAVSKMRQEIQTRGVTDVYQWWFFMATDIIGELTFGESFRMLETGKKTQYILDLETVASSGPIRTTFPNLLKIAPYLPLSAIKRVAERGKRIVQYAEQSVQRYKNMIAQNPENPKPTLFTKLFDTEKSGLTFDDIRQEAQSYIIAGSDTTTVTMTYLTHAVSSDTRIRDKLVAELASLPADFSDNDLRNLPYLKIVILETLRLYSAVPFGLPRTVPREGANLVGYQIPAGVTVSTQAYSLHRDPAIFPDPFKFVPERWESPTKEMKDASLPFGGGSRICLGIHLAYREMRLATALFFREFPQARPSTKEGMSDDDMTMKAWFLMAPKGYRCLMEA
ncbi:hypothetical protein N7492_002681 [Penicillium capsulatum]|uniref:Cytochrome P450 n=1 Tax=Penicillium capsulatum TaxID=69766 RepID=A0A9W9LVF4_9EURO|nr:hypothetical protein N7492_002681 [Penicillium capsulatum]KAJ6122721.1 hypothetical protein N7512_005186 [Penicillium capsulatum]